MGSLTMLRERNGLIALVAVLAVACVALVILNVLRIAESSAEASRQAATYSPPVLPASGAPAVPAITVLGDKAGADVEAVPDAGRLEQGLDGTPVRVTAVDGARYVAVKGRAGATFEAMARRVPKGSTLVALIGGARDRSASLTALATAAAKAVHTIQQRAPSAEIVVVGPLSVGSGNDRQSLTKVRATLRAAASAAAVHWVDPVADRWLAGPSAVTSNGRLTRSGQQELARRLIAVLSPYTR